MKTHVIDENGKPQFAIVQIGGKVLDARAIRGLKLALSKISPFANQEEGERPGGPLDKEKMLEALKTYIESSINGREYYTIKPGYEDTPSWKWEYSNVATDAFHQMDYSFLTPSGEKRGLRIEAAEVFFFHQPPIPLLSFKIYLSDSVNNFDAPLNYSVYLYYYKPRETWHFIFKQGKIDMFLDDFAPFARENNVTVDLDFDGLTQLIRKAADEIGGVFLPQGPYEEEYVELRFEKTLIDTLKSIKIMGEILEEADDLEALIEKIKAILGGFRIGYKIGRYYLDNTVEIEVFEVNV